MTSNSQENALVKLGNERESVCPFELADRLTEKNIHTDTAAMALDIQAEVERKNYANIKPDQGFIRVVRPHSTWTLCFYRRLNSWTKTSGFLLQRGHVVFPNATRSFLICQGGLENYLICHKFTYQGILSYYYRLWLMKCQLLNAEGKSSLNNRIEETDCTKCLVSEAFKDKQRDAGRWPACPTKLIWSFHRRHYFL